ncbi:MAG: hypothetical protein K9G62_01680 [Alphaproteobacteria bacterium]|nr:hypothetical protein [Alphaproteobacteria bacterium]
MSFSLLGEKPEIKNDGKVRAVFIGVNPLYVATDGTGAHREIVGSFNASFFQRNVEGAKKKAGNLPFPLEDEALLSNGMPRRWSVKMDAPPGLQDLPKL